MFYTTDNGRCERSDSVSLFMPKKENKKNPQNVDEGTRRYGLVY
jgi:hypothetical protein